MIPYLKRNKWQANFSFDIPSFPLDVYKRQEITNLYGELSALECVLQFVRSGRVAITTSCFERVNEYLADREAKYRRSKEQEGL